MRALMFHTLLCASCVLASQPPTHAEKPTAIGSLQYANHPFEDPSRRALAEATHKPLRMAVKYDTTASFTYNGKVLSNSLSDAADLKLVQSLMDAAVKFWAGALSVVPVDAPLSFPKTCKADFGAAYGFKCNQLKDAPKCGSYSTVPAEHLAATEYCTACYTDGKCECEKTAAGAGVSNADLLIYVTSVATPGACDATSPTIGYAEGCFRDQYDRPTAGVINWCPAKLSAKPEDFESLVLIAVHELAHVLGFSASSWKYFRKSDGTPYNVRDAAGEPTKTTGYKCPTASGGVQDIAVPGILKIAPGLHSTENVHKILTPTALTVARKYFGCETLDGVEMENQPSTTGTCWGSHFEGRLYSDDTMVAVSISDGTGMLPYKSQLLLAVLQDSGWYKADFSAPGVGVPLWGRNLGCPFVTGKCIDNGVARHPFCDDKDKEGCSADFTHTSYCAMSAYGAPGLPKLSQHFTDAMAGGSSIQMDYCPYFSPFSNGNCRLTSKNDKNQYYGESFGASSYCYASSTLRQIVKGSQMPEGVAKSRCHSTKCGAANGAGEYSVTVGVMKYDQDAEKYVEVSVECTPADAGKQKSISGFDSGTFICPGTDFGKAICAPEPRAFAAQPADCVVGDWANDGECSKTCGTGEQKMTRKVTIAAAYGGTGCPSDMAKTAACNTGACSIAVNCVVGDWANDGECSKTCGTGEQKMTRKVTIAAAYGGTGCPSDMAKTDTCNTDACQVFLPVPAVKSVAGPKIPEDFDYAQQEKKSYTPEPVPAPALPSADYEIKNEEKDLDAVELPLSFDEKCAAVVKQGDAIKSGFAKNSLSNYPVVLLPCEDADGTKTPFNRRRLADGTIVRVKVLAPYSEDTADKKANLEKLKANIKQQAASGSLMNGIKTAAQELGVLTPALAKQEAKVTLQESDLAEASAKAVATIIVKKSAPTTSPVHAPTTPPAHAPSGKKKLTDGELAGIVIGCACLVAGLVFGYHLATLPPSSSASPPVSRGKVEEQLNYADHDN